jgi:Fe-S oxidoreductase
VHQEGFSPRKLIADVLHGNGTAALAACLGCGACQTRCPSVVSFVEFVRDARAAASKPSLPLAHGGVFEVAPELALDRRRWIPRDLRVRDEGDVLCFVGCAPLFDAYFGSLGVRTLGAASSMIRIMNTLGIEPVVLSEEVCCGHDQLWSGDREAFQRLATRNVELIQQAGAKTVVTACAECARCLGLDYPELLGGVSFQAVHVSRWLAEHLPEADVKLAPVERRVTYQDPCRLGRHLGETQAPRDVLHRIPGLELREMPQAGADAVCCGTEGFSRCGAVSKAIQASRLVEAAATGATTLVTACPKCLVHLACARRDPDVEGDIQIRDLTEIVSEALGNDQAHRKEEAR